MVYHVGARFEGLDALVLTAPSVLHCIFFTILTLLSERCDNLCVAKIKIFLDFAPPAATVSMKAIFKAVVEKPSPHLPPF